MTWTARSPGRNRGLPRSLREDASSVTVGESEASVKVHELLSLGISPCGTYYRSPAPDVEFSACGRPRGHSGPHWAVASQGDLLFVAGIEGWVNG